jgi:hypothetical protein
LNAGEMVPQRVTVISGKSDSILSELVESELESICEALDSELVIRLVKQEEYSRFQELLNDSTSDQRKFYSRTGIRGIIATGISENNDKVNVSLIVTNLYSGEIEVNELQLPVTDFISSLPGLRESMDRVVRGAFPLVDNSLRVREQISLVRIIRNAPDFSLSFSGRSGYNGRQTNYLIGSSVDIQQDFLHGVIPFAFSIDAKIKRLHLGVAFGFSLFITDPVLTSENNYLFNSGVPWLSVSGTVEAGLYLAGDMFRISAGITLESITGQNPLNLSAVPVLRMVPIATFEVFPGRWIKFIISGGPGLLFYNQNPLVMAVSIVANVDVHFFVYRGLFLLSSFAFDYSDFPYVGSPGFDGNYYTRFQVGAGYRFEWREKT